MRMQDCYTLNEVAKKFGVSKQSVSRWISIGQLPCFRRDGIKAIFIPCDAADNFMRKPYMINRQKEQQDNE